MQSCLCVCVLLCDLGVLVRVFCVLGYWVDHVSSLGRNGPTDHQFCHFFNTIHEPLSFCANVSLCARPQTTWLGWLKKKPVSTVRITQVCQPALFADHKPKQCISLVIHPPFIPYHENTMEWKMVALWFLWYSIHEYSNPEAHHFT